MVTVQVEEVYAVEPPSRIGWGWQLAAGIGWFVLGLLILSAHPGTIALISYAVATVVLLAGVMEIAAVFLAPGWKWLHAMAGAVFVIAGILAFTQPFQTFLGLAILFGWFLLIKGMVVLIGSLSMRAPGSLWGLGIAVGIGFIALGLWAIGYPVRSSWLLVLWIGIGAVFHGIWDIVQAFHYRSAQ